MSADSSLETLLEEAFHGNKDSAEEFFKSFLTEKLYVPLRHQSMPLSNAPEYPNDLVSVLGVKSIETTFVPVFTDDSGVVSWCGQELDIRELQGAAILDLIPENWWLVLNPASEYEKEFSPWEIGKLKEGQGSIPEILEDIFEEGKELGIEIEVAESAELTEIKNKLLDLAKGSDSIVRLGCVFENDDSDKKRVLFAVRLKDISNEDLQGEIRSVIEQALIGGFDHRIVFDTGENPSLAVGHLGNDHFFYSKDKQGGRLAAAFNHIRDFLK